MQAAARGGVPVPAVRAANGPDLLMDVVPGPTMLTQMLAHPDEVREHAGTLAALHARLDRVRLGRPAGDRLGLLHGDLHPGNVILSPDGPVLVDWTNNDVGPRSLDVAMTWLLLACFAPPIVEPAGMAAMRAALVEGFLERVDRVAARRSLTDAADVRLRDANTTVAERERIRDLLR